MCNVVCRLTLDEKTAKEFKEKIDDEYRVNMWETLMTLILYSQLCAINVFVIKWYSILALLQDFGQSSLGRSYKNTSWGIFHAVSAWLPCWFYRIICWSKYKLADHYFIIIDLSSFWPVVLNFWQSKEAKYFIHNHLKFVVKYHKHQVTEVSRIVGFEVNPFRLYYISFLTGCKKIFVC